VEDGELQSPAPDQGATESDRCFGGCFTVVGPPVDEHVANWKDPPFLMGKPWENGDLYETLPCYQWVNPLFLIRVIFNSYVSLPEGRNIWFSTWFNIWC
jgi:hypothetical protein